MKRTYVGELEWALSEIYRRNGADNPHREFQINAAAAYGAAVAEARRERWQIPERPNLDGCK